MEIYVEGVDDLGEDQEVILIRTGDFEYTYFSDGFCLTNQVGEAVNPATELLDSFSFMESIDNAVLVEESLELNGVLVNRFHFEPSDTPIPNPTFGDFSQFSGDIYVDASTGQFVHVETEGTVDGGQFFDEDAVETTFTFELSESDADGPINIEIPAGCAEPGELDYPILDDAYEQSTGGGLAVYYKSNTLLSDAREFYSSQMTADGWVVDENETVLGDPVSLLVFARDGVIAKVTLSQTDSETLEVFIEE
jgi:hypothetical protein